MKRIFFWAERKAAQKAFRLKRLCNSLLDAEIRCLEANILQLGEDDTLDLVVEYVARQLTGRDLLAEFESVADDNRVSKLFELAKNSKDAMRVVARYHATDAFFAGLLKNDVHKAGQLALARAACSDTAEYDSGEIYKEHTKTVKRLAMLRKQLAERSALKMDLSIVNISESVALVTAVFVVAGFLHVNYFYRRMGVEVSLYFSVSDYLAASVEQIREGAFAAANAIVVFGHGIRFGSLRSKLQIQAEAAKRRRQDWIFGAFAVLLVAATTYFVYIGKPNFSQIRVAGFVLAYWLADYLARSFFRNRLVAMTAIVAALIFGLNVGVSAYERSEKLLEGKGDAELVQKLHFKDSSPAIAGELFGANGSYYFFYERDIGVTHVVPRDRISQIDITKKKQ